MDHWESSTFDVACADCTIPVPPSGGGGAARVSGDSGQSEAEAVDPDRGQETGEESTLAGEDPAALAALPLPTSFRLLPPQPNPAGGTVTIRFEVPAGASGKASVTVYDVSGRRVRTLVSGTPVPGRHTVLWGLDGARGGRVAPGVYFVRMESGTFVAVKKVSVLR